MNTKTAEVAISKSTDQSENVALCIALAGNPNAGKTTLFNALTGLRQKVANYSGVTVERKEGAWKLNDGTARLIDLPGLYSLDATSLDEQIARDVLTGKLADFPKPDAIIAVVDATNLERNLYLVTQLFEYEIPVVVALTMVDAAEKQSLVINTKKLSEMLGVPVVPIKATQKIGIRELAEQVGGAVKNNQRTAGGEALADGLSEADFAISVWRTTTRLIVKSSPATILFPKFIRNRSTAKRTEERQISEKIDRVLTHKFFGLDYVGRHSAAGFSGDFFLGETADGFAAKPDSARWAISCARKCPKVC